MSVTENQSVDAPQELTHAVVNNLVASTARQPIKLPPFQPHLVPIADNIFNAAREFGVDVDEMNYVHAPQLAPLEPVQPPGDMLTVITNLDQPGQALVLVSPVDIRRSKKRSSIASGLFGIVVGVLGMWVISIRQTPRNAGGDPRNLAASKTKKLFQRLPSVWSQYPPLPDPNRTPGETSILTSAERLPHDTFKDVFMAYGVTPSSPNRSVCRLIPVEFGGTNNAANLFPLDKHWSSLKWKLDSALVEQYKRGKITPQQARTALSKSWVNLLADHNISTR